LEGRRGRKILVVNEVLEIGAEGEHESSNLGLGAHGEKTFD
jgi:hypothetical protein